MRTLLTMFLTVVFMAMVCSCGDSQRVGDDGLLPIPDKMVVLTFDDRSETWRSYVTPLLKSYGFGATFFIAEAEEFLYFHDEKYWISWEQLRELDEMGFEIGNHSYSHANFNEMSIEEAVAEVEQMDRACLEHGIHKPVSLAYPGGAHSIKGVKALEKKGYLFGRRGVGPEYVGSLEEYWGPVYDPQQDHPYLIPAAYVWGSAFSADSISATKIYGRGSEVGSTLEDFAKSVSRARDGKIAVVVFHGVPDYYEHCSATPEDFAGCMKYLHEEGYTVIAMRDLAKYVNTNNKPADPYEPIRKRMERMKAAGAAKK